MTLYHWGMLLITVLTVVSTVTLSFAAARSQSRRGVELGHAAHKRLDGMERAAHAREVQSAVALTRLQTQVEDLTRRHSEARDAFLAAVAELRTTISGRLDGLEDKVDSLVKDGCARRCA